MKRFQALRRALAVRALLPIALAFTALSSSAQRAGGTSAASPSAVSLPLLDCNGNGVEDAVDIALGASSDADLDGIPDECELR